jgi:hypothetical protein
MKTLIINLPIDSYSVKSNILSRTGEIFVQADEDYYFPSKNWTDFGSTIIFWWAEAVAKLLSEKESRVKCDFMDGSYRFDIEKTNSTDIWHVYFIKETSDEKEVIEQEFDIKAKQFADEILKKTEIIQNKLKSIQNNEGLQRVKSFRNELRLLRDDYFGV